ncbi:MULTISPECIES: MBL fold metallo-hydrolase [Bacteria]|uniref:MBL fold metallo-hydrolase n=1 Tax=Bacteria TaxID=2 RepID=UPI003F4121C8
MIEIKSFNAKNGDSFYLYFPEEKFNILIDGGYSSTYKDEIKLELEKIKARGEELDLLIVTHIDNDHISGIIKLIEENGSNEESKIIKIKEVWFNSYFNSPTEKININLDASMQLKLKQEIKTIDNHEYFGEIGINEMKKLSDLLLEGKYKINESFDYFSINTAGKTIISKGPILFRILSPEMSSLIKLDEEFNKKIDFLSKQEMNIYNNDLNKYFEKFVSNIENEEQTTEVIEINSHRNIIELSEVKDVESNTISNETSIAFLIEYNNKKILFLGDASLSVYNRELCKIYSNLNEIIFDFIKLSHHGSKNNISTDFINRINCLNYFISTDGSGNHEHPNKETIAKLIVNSNNKIKILLNTRNKSHDRWIDKLKDNIELRKKYNYEIEIRNYIKI